MKGFRGPLKKILAVLRSFSLLGVWSGGLGVCAVRPGGILFKPDVQLSADSARAVSFFVHAPVCFGFPFPPANRLCLGRRHRVRGHGLHPPLEPVSARLAPVPADAIRRRFPLLTPPDETEQQPRPTPCGAAVRFCIISLAQHPRGINFPQLPAPIQPPALRTCKLCEIAL